MSRTKDNTELNRDHDGHVLSTGDAVIYAGRCSRYSYLTEGVVIGFNGRGTWIHGKGNKHAGLVRRSVDRIFIIESKE